MTGAPTTASYFEAFGPVPAWEDLPTWPPDVFALTNLVLDHTEAYRFAVAPPPGRHWPPDSDWCQRVTAAGRNWSEAPPGTIPSAVAEQWDVVTALRDVPLTALRAGDVPELVEALLTLHAMADEACSGLSGLRSPASPDSFEQRAWALLASHGSLCRVLPVRMRVTPKTYFTSRGITIRSLSRYLALMYESVDIEWRRVENLPTLPDAGSMSEYNVVLVPWPLQVEAGAFHAVTGPVDMDAAAFGFFEFAPAQRPDWTHLGQLLDEALVHCGRVDAVILPEAAVAEVDIAALEEVLAAHHVTFLIAGVRGGVSAGSFGRNYVHLAVLTAAGWQRYRQKKHQRWSLDLNQLRQYHLTKTLDPAKLWWEAIELPPRTLEIIDIGGGRTTAPLICEDLARFDEVGDVVRRIGPSLVVAVLLDGPQLASRWSSHYAAVLADEPGCAVLTLTAFGMASRSRPPGKRLSRVVALWTDASSGRHELELAPGSGALLITVAAGTRTVWTADGRRHDDHTPTLTLGAVCQLRAGRRSRSAMSANSTDEGGKQ